MSGKNNTETFNTLSTGYDNDCMSKSQCFKRFGVMSIEDKPRAGRPLTIVTDETIENAFDSIHRASMY